MRGGTVQVLSGSCKCDSLRALCIMQGALRGDHVRRMHVVMSIPGGVCVCSMLVNRLCWQLCTFHASWLQMALETLSRCFRTGYCCMPDLVACCWGHLSLLLSRLRAVWDVIMCASCGDWACVGELEHGIMQFFQREWLVVAEAAAVHAPYGCAQAFTAVLQHCMCSRGDCGRPQHSIEGSLCWNNLDPVPAVCARATPKQPPESINTWLQTDVVCRPPLC